MEIGLRSGVDDGWDTFRMGTTLANLKQPSGTQESFKEVFISAITVSAREWAFSFYTQCGMPSAPVAVFVVRVNAVYTWCRDNCCDQRLYSQSYQPFCN